MNEHDLRQAIIATALRMNALGINQGKAGNVSARFDDGYLVTPSGLAYDETSPADIVRMDFTGIAAGTCRPSSEWRFHQDIYVARPEVNAVVHTHSPYATTLACMGLEVPAENLQSQPKVIKHEEKNIFSQT